MLAIARATGASLGLVRWKLLLVAAFFGIFAYNALVFVGLTLGPASDGAVLVPTLNPVLTVFIATFLGERLTATSSRGSAARRSARSSSSRVPRAARPSRHSGWSVTCSWSAARRAGASTRRSARSRPGPARHSA
jgi:EamA-like transporter family protein